MVLGPNLDVNGLTESQSKLNRGDAASYGHNQEKDLSGGYFGRECSS